MGFINKKNLTGFFVIILISIILLEIILRISGSFYTSSIINKEDYKDKTVIVCAGDSFTYGVGVPRGFDYPSILEKKLNNKDIKVINIGEPGANTSVVYNRLEILLSKIRPDYVILMAGVNNLWNFKDKYEKQNFFIKIISELKIMRLLRFLKYRDNNALNIFGKKDIYELLYADNNISNTLSSKKTPNISNLKYINEKFELLYNSQQTPQSIINTLNSIEKLQKQHIIDYIISLINLGKYSQAYNFAQRFNKTLDKQIYEKLMGLIVFYSSNKDYLINYLENIQYPKTSIEIIRILNSLENNNFIEQKKEIEKRFNSIISKSYENSKIDKIIKGINVDIEDKEDIIFNIRHFSSKIEITENEDKVISNCYAFFNSFEFSPSIPRLLKIPWNFHKDINYNNFEEIKIVEIFLKWIEEIPDNLYIKVKSNLAGVYFKYAFVNTNTVYGLDLLFKAIELEPQNIDFLKNISYFSQNPDVLQKRGQKIFSIISESLKKELISPQLLKDISMNIKRVYNGREDLISLKSEFDELYLKYKKDDEKILTEYSDDFLKKSDISQNELKKAIEWHENILKITDNKKILFNYGILLKRSGRTADSCDILISLNSEYPDDKDIMMFLSYIYSELIIKSPQKYLKQAEEHFKKTFELITESINKKNSDIKEILEMLSILYLIKAQNNVEFLDTSIDWHENIVKENLFSELFYNYAILLSMKEKNYKDIEKILKNIKTAIKLETQNKKYYEYEEKILTEFSENLALKNYSDNETLQQALIWHKKYIDIYEYEILKFNYAVLLRINKESLKSLEIVRRLCQKYPNELEYLTFLALIYSDYAQEISQKDYKQAEEILENGIKEINNHLKKQPEDNNLKQTIEKIFFEYSNGIFARVIDNHKDLNKALDWHKDILKISENTRVKYNYAVILQKDNKINKSIELMEKLYTLEPENTEYIMFLAYLYSNFIHNVNSEDFKKAEKLLKKAYKKIYTTQKDLKDEQIQDILKSLSSLYLNKTRNDFRNIEEALQWHKNIVKDYNIAELFYNYGILISLTGTDEKITEHALSYIDKAIILKKENSEFKKTALELYRTRLKHIDKDNDKEEKTGFSNEIMKWIKNDIKKTFNILLSHKIKVIFMNYPDFQLDNTQDIIKDENVYFIDNMKYFNSLNNKEELFFPDGHLNIEGNERLAENIKNYLLKNGDF